MANPLKEILLGIREGLAFERSQPYKATLAATEARGQFNTQLRDQLEDKFKKSSEAGPGVMLGIPTSEPVIPYESLNDRFKRVAIETKERLNKEGTPRKNALEVLESFPPLADPAPIEVPNSTPVGGDIKKEYGWIQQRIKDLEEKEKVQGGKLGAEDKENLIQLKKGGMAYKPFLSEQEPPKNKIEKAREIQTQEKLQQDLGSVEREKQLTDFARRHKSGELKIDNYDSYRELLVNEIDLLVKRVGQEKDRESQYPLELERRKRVEEYLNATRRQVSMLVQDIKDGRIDARAIQAIRERYEKVKKDFEGEPVETQQHEIEAARIYLDQVGQVLNIKKDSAGFIAPTPSQQEPKPKDSARDAKIKPGEDYERWLEILKKSDNWESFQSNLNDIGHVVSGDRTFSSESMWKRVLRVKEEFGRAKGNDKINTSLVREAFAGIPPELRSTVTRLLEVQVDTASNPEPVSKDNPKVEADPIADDISEAKTWDELDKAIRSAGEIKSAGIEYTANEVLGQITDIRDAFKMANGNFDTATFKSALEVLTGARGIRAKVLELLDRENEEKYFKAGDRVVFEGKKWDIVRVENGKALIQTLSEDKKTFPDRIVPLTDLASEVKPIESQVPLEEDFEKPVEATITGGPETTAIPEEVPQWRKDFQEQVNKSFEAYRSRFYRKYRDESEVYEEYQRKVNRGWVGWLKDRYASFSTFGITDFHAAEKFRVTTGEAGAQIEFVADTLAREGTEANDAYMRSIVNQTLGRLVKQFEGKRASNGRPVLTDEKLKSLEDRLIIELRATQQEKIMRARGELTKILRNGLDQKWWLQYVYGTVGTSLASINLSYAMPVIAKWIFGSGVVAVPPGAVEGTAKSVLKNVAPNAIDSVKNMPSAWDLAAGENPWSVSEKLLRTAGKAVNPDTIKLVDAALCRENGIGVPEWAIPGTVNHGAVAVGTTLKIANALRVIASMP